MLLNKYNWKIYQKFLNVFSAAKDKIEKLIAISNDLFAYYGVLFYGWDQIYMISRSICSLPAVGFLPAVFCSAHCPM